MSKLFKRFRFYLALCIIIAALSVSLIRALTPWIVQYQTKIENYASKLLGNTVVIGQMETGWYWFQPVVKMTNLAVLKGQKPILDAQQLIIGINLLSSLWHWQLEPGVLYLDKVHLVFYQGKQGWKVEGFSLKDNQHPLFNLSSPEKILELIFMQKKLILKHVSADVHLKDGNVITIKQFNFLSAQSFGRYKLKANIMFGKAKPTTIEVMASLIFDPANLANISGELYVHLQDLQLAQWREFLKTNDFQFSKGLVNGPIWLNLQQSHLVSVQSKLRMKQLEVERLETPQNTHFYVDNLSGNMAWFQQATGWQLSGDQVHLKLNKEDWPQNEFFLEYNKAEASWHLSIEHLLLKSLFAQPFSWPPAMQPLIQAHVHGNLQDTVIHIKNNQLAAVWGHFYSLGWYRPGTALERVENLTGSMEWQPSVGRMALESENILIKPKAKPAIYFEELNTGLNWKKNKQDWSLVLERFVLRRPDLLVSLSGRTTWNDGPKRDLTASEEVFGSLSSIPPIHPDLQSVAPAVAKKIINSPADSGTISLKGGISAKGAKRWLQYLPAEYLKPKLNAWLKNDIKRIDTMVVDVNVDGPTAEFPFDADTPSAKTSVFKINAHLSGLDLVFAPHWPLTRDIEAYLYVDKRDLRADIVYAILKDIRVDEVNLRMHNLGLNQDTLLVHGQVNTTGSKALKYALDSPLAEKLTLLKLLEVSGIVNLDLQLEAPLYPGNDTILAKGNLEFRDDTLLVHHRLAQVQLDRLMGHVDFDHNGILPSHLKASLLDAPVLIHLKPVKEPNSGILVDLKGKLPIKKLQAKLSPTIFSRMQGKIDFKTQLRINQDPGDLDSAHFSSDLKGLEILWPEPLGKSIDTVKPLTVDFDFSPTKGAQARLTYADLLIQAAKNLNDDWSIEVNEAILAGKFLYQEATKKWSLNLKHLYWPKGALYFEGNDSFTDLKTKDFPNIEVKIEDFRYLDWDLGTLDCQASNQKTSWVIDLCTLMTPFYTIKAQGEWKQVDVVNQSRVEMKVGLSDLAQTLTRWKITPVVAAKQGDIQAQLQWPGAFYDFSLAKLEGFVMILLRNGELTHLDPATVEKLSLGKLFSILNLQTLPRRLKLDFSDLSHKGYVFDVFRGNFTIDKGLMSTKDGIIDGPVASASIRGSLDIVHQLYDLQVKIAPHLTSSLPIVATIAGGPIAGAATWVASKIINQGMQRFSAYRYKITGPWKEPDIEQTSIFKALDKKINGVGLEPQ